MLKYFIKPILVAIISISLIVWTLFRTVNPIYSLAEEEVSMLYIEIKKENNKNELDTNGHYLKINKKHKKIENKEKWKLLTKKEFILIDKIIKDCEKDSLSSHSMMHQARIEVESDRRIYFDFLIEDGKTILFQYYESSLASNTSGTYYECSLGVYSKIENSLLDYMEKLNEISN